MLHLHVEIEIIFSGRLRCPLGHKPWTTASPRFKPRPFVTRHSSSLSLSVHFLSSLPSLCNNSYGSLFFELSPFFHFFSSCLGLLVCVLWGKMLRGFSHFWQFSVMIQCWKNKREGELIIWLIDWLSTEGEGGNRWMKWLTVSTNWLFFFSFCYLVISRRTAGVRRASKDQGGTVSQSTRAIQYVFVSILRFLSSHLLYSVLLQDPRKSWNKWNWSGSVLFQLVDGCFFLFLWR